MSNQDGLTPPERGRLEQTGAALVEAAAGLPVSAPPKAPSLPNSVSDMRDVPAWASGMIEMMAARLDQSIRLNREAWEGLNQASQTMLATAKVMQALIGEFDGTLSGLAQTTGQLSQAVTALVQLYGEYDAFLGVLMDEEAEQEQDGKQPPNQ